jgi:chromatin remodeling complex protein RSC6
VRYSVPSPLHHRSVGYYVFLFLCAFFSPYLISIVIMSSKQVASEIIVTLQNQFRDKVADNVQRFLSKIDKRRLGDSTTASASTNLIMSMNRAGNWYAASLEKSIRKELRDELMERKKARTPRPANPALTRKYVLSDNLSGFMDSTACTRQDALRRVWDHIKGRGLKDGSGKIRVDDTLRPVLGTGDINGLVRNTEIMGLMSKHFIRPE